MQYKPFYAKNKKMRSVLPKMPPSSFQEPTQGVQANRIVCSVCGKTFRTHPEYDRHYENMHGTPERTHEGRHDFPHE